MADALTALLQFTAQETGGNDNNWGVILNATLQKIEDAIAGTSSVVVTGGTTILNDDQNRPGILLLSGALSSDSTVEVKARTKSWIVYNGTSGNYSVTIKTNGNPGYVLPRGASAHLWCNGASIFPVDTGAVPVGGIVWFASQTYNLGEPENFLICDGRAINRNLYRRLYDVIGTSWGAGDNTTTFNIPDGKNRYPRGYGDTNTGSAGQLDAKVGSHTHTGTTSADNAHKHTGQTQGNGNHNHSYNRAMGSGGAGYGYSGGFGAVDDTGTEGLHTHTYSGMETLAAHQHTLVINSNEEGAENRPKSITLVPLIRYQ